MIFSAKTVLQQKVLAKYGWLMLGTFDLSNCFYFVTVISTFDTASEFFVVNLSAVAFFVLGESFNCSNLLS